MQWWFFSNYGECSAGNVRVETPEEFAAYDPTLNELISRVFNTSPEPRAPTYPLYPRIIRGKTSVSAGNAASSASPMSSATRYGT